MTLDEAIAFLLHEFHLGDHVYDARERSHDMEPLDIENSWDHPFVKKFSEAVDALERVEKDRA